MKNIPEGNAQRLIDHVVHFADNVVEQCHDRYGEKKTPLLVDGINTKTGEPIKWTGFRRFNPDLKENVLSNLACQQNFLRTLDGLYAITGKTKYRRQATEWIEYALRTLQDTDSGMLYWGGHTSYDLLKDKPLIGNHELKCVYPYYRFLYKVDPDATQLAIEGFWNKHVKNWSNLLFNRHGEYTSYNRESMWEHKYEGGSLPIIDNSMLSFINTGSDLIYAGSILFKLSGNKKTLLWAKRLLKRYDEIRNKATGLGGYQFNHREPCRVRISFNPPLNEREDVNETTVITNGVIQTRYGRAALTWLNLFEELGVSDGQDFLDLAIKDLTAIGEHAYDFSDHSFFPVLVDGTKLSPSDCIEGAGYCNPRKLRKIPANGLMFLTYAKAYRLTKNEFFYKILRSLAMGMGWGELPNETNPRKSNSEVDLSTISRSDTFTLFGLLELYYATDQREYLIMAIDLGNRLIESYFADGFFTTGKEATDNLTRIDSHLPVALLHLAAAIQDKSIDLPKGKGIPLFYPNSTSFNPKVIIARLRKRQDLSAS